MNDNYYGCPEIIREFLFYMETIRNLSPRTISGYWTDLRTFFRYLKLKRNLISSDTPFEEIPIDDVDISLVSSVSTMDIYEYLHFVMKDRQNSPAARSRCSRRTTAAKSSSAAPSKAPISLWAREAR